MSKLLTLSVCALLVCGSTVAQITIQTNDFQPAVGTNLTTSQASGVTENLFNTVTSGSGGGHTWDFSALVFNMPFGGTVIDKASAPAADSFPDANIVIVHPFGNDTTWNFLRSVPTAFEDLGNVVRTSFGETITVHDPASDQYFFPMQYTDEWMLARMQHTVVTPEIYTELHDTTWYSVDAYGMAEYRGNSFPCLRISQLKRVIQTTFVSGMPTFSTETITEMANFVAAGFDVLVTIGRSTYTGGSTYFASGSASFYNAPTAIIEIDPGRLPDGFALAQNYPNPFNPTTDIAFSLPTASEIHLDVYNVLGQRTRTLVNQSLPAGSYSVNWDGRNETGQAVASGIYFYRLTTSDFASSRKMLLLK